MDGLTLTDFIRTYAPVANRPEYANRDPFEFREGEVQLTMDYYFREDYPENVENVYLWTCSSADGLIYPGIRYVDSLCYYVSSVPWTRDTWRKYR
jgi:hypothetical protein